MHHLKDNNINFLSAKIILVKVNCNKNAFQWDAYRPQQ